MGEIIVPILIFAIPLSAIFLRSPLARSLSRYIDAVTERKVMGPQIEEIETLREEVKGLNKKVDELQESSYRLEEKYSFLERLLEPPKS